MCLGTCMSSVTMSVAVVMTVVVMSCDPSQP